MPKARRRKDSSFETSVTKSVFLYGDPNKEKLALLKQMQDVFTALVNEKILMLDAREDLILQLVKNDKKDTVMRSLEKAARRKGLNSAFCQNAFDMAVTCLSNRLDTIRLDLLSEGAWIFARSKVLFAMSIMGKTKTEMVSAMESLKKDFRTWADGRPLPSRQFVPLALSLISWIALAPCKCTDCLRQFLLLTGIVKPESFAISSLGKVT